MVFRSNGKVLVRLALLIVGLMLCLPPWTWSEAQTDVVYSRLAFSFWWRRPQVNAVRDFSLLAWEIGFIIVAAALSHAVCREKEKVDYWKTFWIKASDPTGALLRPAPVLAADKSELLRPASAATSDYESLLRADSQTD